MTFSPKERYLKNEERALKFTQHVNDPLVIEALELCLADLAYQGISGERLEGVTVFIHEFLNFGSKNTAPKAIKPQRLSDERNIQATKA